MTSSLSSPRRRQQGISLAVCLVLLVLVMVIGLATMRGISMEARMSAAQYDRNIAFQAAETALREAETYADAPSAAASTAGASCAGGYCPKPNPSDTPRELDASFTGWQNATTSVSSNAGTPQLIVESMGKANNWFECDREIPPSPHCSTQRYRLTARSTNANRATVIVQSDYATP